MISPQFPFYTSNLGYAFIFNSPAFGVINLTSEALSWTSYAQLNLDVWISTVSAENVSAPFPELMQHYVDAGFIQCKDRYRNQSQILQVAHGEVVGNTLLAVDLDHLFSQATSTADCPSLSL